LRSGVKTKTAFPAIIVARSDNISRLEGGGSSAKAGAEVVGQCSWLLARRGAKVTNDI
jgi:hypothetical protein